MSKKWITWIVAGLLLAGACLAIAVGTGALNIRLPAKTIDLRDKIVLDIADTDSSRELGLGGRASMADDHGMLFIFEKPGIYPFWMKGMHFPIDIIWINGGIVQEVVPMNPPASPRVLPDTHAPIHTADRVLELNKGMANKLGIVPGVRLVLP